ncbi:MAG: acylphosphatase [Thermoproteota archaeon]
MLVRAHVFVSGRVQGVLYRWETLRKARSLDVKGWVKNLPDGRVEAMLEGEEEKVNKLLEWMQIGPEMAVVKSLDVDWQKYTGEFSNFRIVR